MNRRSFFKIAPALVAVPAIAKKLTPVPTAQELKIANWYGSAYLYNPGLLEPKLLKELLYDSIYGKPGKTFDDLIVYTSEPSLVEHLVPQVKYVPSDCEYHKILVVDKEIFGNIKLLS